MASNRSRKIAEDIKRELTDIIRNEVDDPRIDSLTSVIDVEVTSDLSYATIYISKFGSDKEREEALLALKKASGFIRTVLSKRMTTRIVPELIFKLDESLAYGARIEKILHDLED